ncbi:DUF6069 family protein [Microbacterium oleivorans]|uniref:DUF6069 family protein n=1 Tax=Microbacterium oleivorans TaxID=273677 RepID=UPI00203C8D1B|nr:DUF6069 family protein [Microbacterium oleivorans]MCM3696028.1 DUF6069 family protein [Microbacterium oleivorans]
MATLSAPKPNTRLRPRTALLLAAAMIVAVLLNAGAAAVAISLGAPADFGPLSVPAQALFSVIGITVGWIGWRLVRARAKNPRRVLAVLVPAVLVASFVPDVLLLAFPVIPGSNPPAILGLMVMHVIVAACAVAAYVAADRTAAP